MLMGLIPNCLLASLLLTNCTDVATAARDGRAGIPFSLVATAIRGNGDADGSELLLNDGEGGVATWKASALPEFKEIHDGDLVRVDGETHQFGLTLIKVTAIQILERRQLPPAPLVTSDDLASGRYDCRETKVRGTYTIRAYHNDPAANARSFTPDGFYRTGDIVERRADGYLTVRGRAGDHINRAGEKISAEGIEDYLLAHPGVFDAAVVSIPDQFLGERSCAFIVPQADQPKPRQVELKAFVRARGLAEFKVPDQVVFVDAFATTAVGKVSRNQLRAELRARFLEEGNQK